MSEQPQVTVGRPRDPELDTSILEAAREMLLECGYGGVTMEGVARRAGVGKATVYRRWRSKPLLVYDAFFSQARSRMKPSTGSLSDDLRHLIKREMELYRTPGALDAVMGLLSDFSSHPDVEKKLRERFFRPDRSEAVSILEEGARAEGVELDLPIDLIVDAFTGALFVRSTLQRKPLDAKYARQLLRLMLEGAGLGDAED